MSKSSELILQCAECGVRFAWLAAEQTVAAQPMLCPGCRRLVPLAGRRRGIVKWFNRAKGFGFITPPDGPELFVHKSSLGAGLASLRPGQLVEYTVVPKARGAQAEDVVVLNIPTEPELPT